MNDIQKFEKEFGQLITTDPLFRKMYESAIELGKHARGEKTNVRVRVVRPVTIAPLPDFSKEEIKKIRIDAGLTQELFAQVFGSQKSTIVKWESGETKPLGPSMRLLELLKCKEKCLDKIYQIG